MSQSIELQMLNALEFLRYSSFFQGHLFIVVLDDTEKLKRMLTDLRTLRGAGIKTLIVCRDYHEPAKTLELWNQRGSSFRYFKAKSSQAALPERIEALRLSLENDEIPLMSLEDQPGETGSDRVSAVLASALAPYFQVDKIFFLSSAKGLIVDGKFISHLTLAQVEEYLAENHSMNISGELLLRLTQQSQLSGIEFIILPAESGALFQEVFTHKGKGTLITDDYPNIIRKAAMSDVTDVSFMMRPYVCSGALLEVDEDRIAREIDEYYVYSVNDSLVAAAKLNDYGEASELAKLIALPRYQGKGRAKELAKTMIEKARRAGKKYIFALTVEPKMRDFFMSLNFYQCDRSSLPEKWRINYDMKRPSKAFRLDIEK